MGLSTRILQKIVRNEAMASDPPEIYGWRVYLLACSVSCLALPNKTGAKGIILFVGLTE